MNDNDIPSTPLIRVVCAAIRCKETGFIIPGVRHRDAAMRGIFDALPFRQIVHSTDGFLTNTGEFLTREQAWQVATAAGQILNQIGVEGRLHSEHLY